MPNSAAVQFRDRFVGRVSQVLDLPPSLLDMFLASFWCGEHVLLQGPPGTGKSTLAKALWAMVGSGARVQMNSEVSPSDIIGVEVLVSSSPIVMKFQEGPIFSPFLLVDEINRAMPKTQSALLQAMEEKQVEVAGENRPLSSGFFVVATQNPLDLDGTYLLPMSQLDRFGCVLSLEASSGRDLERRLAHMFSRSEPDQKAPEQKELVRESETDQAFDMPKFERLEIHPDWYKVISELQETLLGLNPIDGSEVLPLSLRAWHSWLDISMALSQLRGLDHLSTTAMRESLVPCLSHRYLSYPSQEVDLAMLKAFDRLCD
jgi:MoxR-like ATPase